MSYINKLNLPAQTSQSSQDNQALSRQQQYKNQILQIQNKINLPGYETFIRLVADSQVNLNLLMGSFSIFTQPFGNSFTTKKPRFSAKRKLKKAISEHKPYGKRSILNVLELSSLWHLPTAQISIPNIIWGKRLTLEAPENLSVATNLTTRGEKQQTTYFGKAEYKNKKLVFGIKKQDRFKHMYVVGKSGTGKSWLIANMAIDDIRKGEGVAILDPHGDLSEIVLKYIPKSRVNDVCYFNPADNRYTYPLNILEIPSSNQYELMVSGIISIFYKLYSHSWGPRLEHLLRNVLFTLIKLKNTTLPDVLQILRDKNYRKKKLAQVEDPHIQQFWKHEYENMPNRLRQESISPIVNKVGQFVSSPLIRKIIKWPHSKVKIEELMNQGKILICNLSQGKIGEDNSALLGSMIITQVQLAAMNRAFQSEDERNPFYLYVDEFQNFATQSFSKILSEARKYKLSLVLANQYIDQIPTEIFKAILGNVGSLVSFNIGANDAHILTHEYGNEVDEEDLTTLDRFQMLMRISIDKVSSQPFEGKSIPLPKNLSNQTDRIIKSTREKYGRRLN